MAELKNTIAPFPISSYLPRMSEDASLPYSQTYIVAWTTLSIIICVTIFAAFVFNGPLLDTGHWIWDLIRYFAKPII